MIKGDGMETVGIKRREGERESAKRDENVNKM